MGDEPDVQSAASPLLGSEPESTWTSPPDSPEPAAPHPPSRLPGQAPTLSRLNGMALVVGLQIGSGIFTLPSQVSQFVTAPGYGLSTWLVAGALVWTGAASFIELGLRIPRNGGVQEYLRACWGDHMGFLFSWLWVFVAKPAANSIISTIAANYFAGAFAPGPADSVWAVKGVALGCICFITFVNCLGATSGAKAANLFLVLKLFALGSVIVLGFITWIRGDARGVPASPEGWFGWVPEDRGISAWEWVGNYVTAIFGVLLCYGGWETAGFVAGDMANPEKDLPVVLNGAMALVITGFCLMNAVLYICLPMDFMRTSKTLAVEFARQMLGSWAGAAFSVLVAISVMGALNANVFALGKICTVAGHRDYFPRLFANLHCADAKDEAGHIERTLKRLPSPLRASVTLFASSTSSLRWKRAVPVYATIMNGLLASLFLVGDFNWLVTLKGMTEYTLYFFSVVGLILLRRSEAAEPAQVVASRPGRQYKTWIGNPIIFSVVSSLLIIRGTFNDPRQELLLVLMVLLGLGIFYVRFGPQGFRKPRAEA